MAAFFYVLFYVENCLHSSIRSWYRISQSGTNSGLEMPPLNLH